MADFFHGVSQAEQAAPKTHLMMNDQARQYRSLLCSEPLQRVLSQHMPIATKDGKDAGKCEKTRFLISAKSIACVHNKNQLLFLPLSV